MSSLKSPLGLLPGRSGTNRAVDDLVRPTTAGLVRGTHRNGMRTWRGIPFAAPPVGALRFRAPEPPIAWRGVREATEHGPVPYQERLLAAIGAGRWTPMDEDCLTLGVTAPDDDARPRPVMVFIYGGANTFGSTAATAYDGAGLAKAADVLHVSFNYRIGPFGFLDFSGYSGSRASFDTNLGVRDQIAALRWVQENIAAFGGDPDRVTVFGESAGGTATTTLLATPSAKGLFGAAIAESPAPGAVFGQERTAAWAARFLDLLGAEPSDAELALSTASPKALLAAAKRLAQVGPRENPGTLAYCPVVDGDLLPASPVDAARAGTTLDVPLIIGTNAREGSFFPYALDILPTTPRRIERLFTDTDPAARDRVLGAYPKFPGRGACVDFGGDYAFWNPSVRFAEGHGAHAPTWMYRYDFAPRALRLTGLDATHGSELTAVFGGASTPLGLLMTSLGGRRGLLDVSRRVQERWSGMAHGGDPGADWPRYDAERRATLVIDRKDTVVEDPHAQRREAWEDYDGYR